MAPRNLCHEAEAELSFLRMAKRKYSPIVWDRDDKVCKLSSYNGISSHKQLTNNLLSAGSFRLSTGFHGPRAPVKSIGKFVSDVYVTNGVSCTPVQGHNTGSCRWVDDVEEGEISDSPADKGFLRMKQMSGDVSVEMQGSKKLASPQFVERRREGSGGSSGKSSGSDKGSNHSMLTNEYAEKDLGDECDMEIDGEQNCGDTSVSHLNTDSEDECRVCDTPEPAASIQRSANMVRACRNVNDFEKVKTIGAGTYGVVYKAKNKINGEIVALKRVKMDNDSEEGFPLTSLREINILCSFDHPSIIDIKEVVAGGKSDHIFLVMEYMDSDLKALMDSMRKKKQQFCQSEVKCLMLQLLEGVKYLHDNWVLHRDLKTSNLLVNNRGELKICDFGMARQYGSPLKPYTQLVVTLWYRAPELLLGAEQYSAAIDMWSVGCIMAELLLNEPLFNGNNEINQIHKIFKMLGTPNETSWPGFSKLPTAARMKFDKQPDNLLRNKFPGTSFTGGAAISNAGFDLLKKLLTCCPEKRITADAALNHHWFREVPLPKSKDCMPTFSANH